MIAYYSEKGGGMEKKSATVDITNSIKEKAKELWEKDGRQQGRDMDYWLQAERIVKAQARKQ